MTLHSRFDEIADHMDEAMERAIKDTAEHIVALARARVPVESGDLMRAIHEEKVIGGAEPDAGDHRRGR